MIKRFSILLLLFAIFCFVQQTEAQKSQKFTLDNYLDLEEVSETQISPDGSRIVYVRHFKDKMNDQQHSNLWIINADSTRHRPLTSGNNNYGSPHWSPDGERLLYTSSKSGSDELYIRWMDTGQTAKITNLPKSPGSISWSPNGEYITFTMFVPEDDSSMISLPGKPEGAKWATPATEIDDVHYRSDGLSGFLPKGYRHVFTIPFKGGTPRQITSGPYNYSDPQWTSNSEHLIVTTNRQDNREYSEDSELFKISLEDGNITQLTDRFGPDSNPAISPDGTQIAYTGYDEQNEGFQVSDISVMNIDGSNKKTLSENFDRSVSSIRWAPDGEGLYFQYATEGNGKIGYISTSGEVQKVVDNVNGDYALASNGTIAYTFSSPHIAENLAVVTKNSEPKRLTRVNKDLFSRINLGDVEEFWYKSSHDGLKIQGWIVKPPNFDPDKKYPLILQIHGGPYSYYNNAFDVEFQVMASAGYVVVYVNPRGSTSYGKEFAMHIDENYPSQDYNDLMSGVDAVIDKGYINSDSLYITGGSGGGVLTTWSIGKTDRFNAAVASYPVVNWYSWALTADMYLSGVKDWTPGKPWENREWYMNHSPISLVDNVNTPTMLITGDEDYRTPMSETEQYYNALQLQKVESMMVRVPNEAHGVSERPSHKMAKIAYILQWFGMH